MSDEIKEGTSTSPRKKRRGKKDEPADIIKEAAQAEAIRKLMADVSLVYADMESVKKTETKDLENCARNVLSEHLDCFVLLGYNIHGERVMITQASSNMYKDALVSYILNYATYLTSRKTNEQ